MNTNLLDQFAAQGPSHLQNTNTCTARKFPAAVENARKAYLRTLYGFQPKAGFHLGRLYYADVKGSSVTVEIYFDCGSPPVGVFELPLHLFKRNGMPVECSDKIKTFTGDHVSLIVSGRHKFNGISLSTVTSIEFYSSFEQMWAARAAFKVALE